MAIPALRSIFIVLKKNNKGYLLQSGLSGKLCCVQFRFSEEL
jgi:hypothetical protein